MKLIDLEHHYWDLETIYALEGRKGYPTYDRDVKKLSWRKGITYPLDIDNDKVVNRGEGRLSDVDRVGISTSVLSTTLTLEEIDPSEGAALAKHHNDAIYELTQKYPGRYLGSAMLPVKDADAACKELERCVKELGFVGWQTQSNYFDATLNEERFIPIFETAAELGVYIYLHPVLPPNLGLEEYGFTFMGPAAGFTVDTMLTCLKMIVCGVFDKVPKTKLVLGHLGEAIPFLLDRIDNRLNYLPNPNIKNQRKPSEYFRDNIYVTTSGNMSPAAFRCTKDVLGIEKIMFGSDYPMEDLDAMIAYVRGLEMTDEEREMVFFKNAEKLMGKTL